jgi:ribosome biogenesis protein Nip4
LAEKGTKKIFEKSVPNLELLMKYKKINTYVASFNGGILTDQ